MGAAVTYGQEKATIFSMEYAQVAVGFGYHRRIRGPLREVHFWQSRQALIGSGFQQECLLLHCISQERWRWFCVKCSRQSLMKVPSSFLLAYHSCQTAIWFDNWRRRPNDRYEPSIWRPLGTPCPLRWRHDLLSSHTCFASQKKRERQDSDRFSLSYHV